MPDVGTYLFDPSPGPPDALTYGLGVFFVVGLILSLFLYIRRRHLFTAVPLLVRIAGKTGLTGGIISALGVLFAIAAFFQVPVLAARFWLIALFVVSLALLIYLIYYLRVRLPTMLANIRQQQARQRFMPRSGAKRSGKKKGKRGKK